MKKVAISTGGSGGHVLLAQKIGARLKDSCEVTYIGVGLEDNRFLLDKSSCISVKGGNFSNGMITGLTEIGKGCKESRHALERLQIEHVIGLGSFHSLPPLCAAFYLGIPFSLVEPNAYPGKVNRALSWFAKNTFIQFPSTSNHLWGNTSAVSLEEREKSGCKKEARRFFGLKENVPTLLIFGGSQGAETINNLVFSALDDFPKEIQVLHFTGKEVGGEEKYKEKGIPAFVTPFCKEMQYAYLASDFAISRSGASAVAELIDFEVPSLLIPFPHASDDHQKWNAKFAEKVGGALLVLEHEMTKEKLCDTLAMIFAKPSAKLEEMRGALKAHTEREKSPFLMDVIRDLL